MDVIAKVTESLVEALGIEPEQVTQAARLQADLSAESIDMLDIIFRLERTFDIKIARDELFPDKIFQGDPALFDGENVSAEGLALLKSTLPHADFAQFEQDPKRNNISDLFTVGLIVKFVESKLAKIKP